MENKLEHNDLYEKGAVLMQSALKKYAEGDFEGGNIDREKANEYYDKAQYELERAANSISMLYGENRNFGIIYTVIEENIKNYIKENKNAKIVSNFIKLIKDNKILKEQFNIYNVLCNNIIDIDAEEYLNEALTIIPNFNKKEIFENNSKLIDFIKDNKMDEYIDIDDDRMELFESIEYFLLNKKSLKNIEEYKKNKDIIKESINNRVIENKNNSNDIVINESEYNSDLRNAINKYLKELNEDELNLIEEICKNDKKEVFEKYKNETLNFISEQLTNSLSLEDKLDWNQLLNRIKLKEYKEETLLKDIISFISAKNIIEE